jgi:hypothetical protein
MYVSTVMKTSYFQLTSTHQHNWSQRTKTSKNQTQESRSAVTSLSVPTSMTTGRQYCGGTPPIAVYNESLPTGIPIPYAPRSPSPRILSPSVTTTAYKLHATIMSKTALELNSVLSDKKLTIFKLMPTDSFVTVTSHKAEINSIN